MESQSKIIVQNANINLQMPIYFYCAGMVNFTMLALLSEVFGELRNTRPRVTDDSQIQTADCDNEDKSQYRQEVAHGRNPRMHEKVRFEFKVFEPNGTSRDRRAWLSGSCMYLQ